MMHIDATADIESAPEGTPLTLLLRWTGRIDREAVLVHATREARTVVAASLLRALKADALRHIAEETSLSVRDLPALSVAIVSGDRAAWLDASPALSARDDVEILANRVVATTCEAALVAAA